MTGRTLLLGREAADRVVCVPRMTAAKEGEGLVMVLMPGTQVVAAAVAETTAVIVGAPK